MQLKGLVRFFTVLLIVYSLYQLSFTWFVRNHEKKMEARARNYVKNNFPGAEAKYPGNKDSQAIYTEELEKIYQKHRDSLIKNSENTTVTYGINGAMSYKKAKEEELNLGLDLQGGMNVTLEVEMTGLLKSLANNSTDPNFLAALKNADDRKANSDADFITLFIQEYRKLEPNRPLATLFSGASSNAIDIKSSDSKVESYIRDQAKSAFNLTFDRLSTRIDQFGVAQPSINPIPNRGLINVELPGIKDKDRVRKLLQSTANLQFWEVYTLQDNNYGTGWQRTILAFNAKYGGVEDTTAKKDSAAPKVDTTQNTVTKTTDTTKPKTLSDDIGKTTNDTGGKKVPADQGAAKITIDKYLQFGQPYRDEKGNVSYPSAIGAVAIRDTALFRSYLNEFKGNFPSDIVWAYGIPEKDKKGKASTSVPLYALKTYNRIQAKLEGDAISEARQDFDQYGKVQIEMKMKPAGASIWKKMTEENVGKPIAIVLDNVVQSAPNVINAIPNGISSISGSYTQQEAADLANILMIGKLPAPAKIVQEQQVGPTLGAEAIRGGSLAFIISFVVIFLLMLVYYNTSGWVANIALILNLLFTVGILAGLGATLTAPGIAGLVLTIGMAVDTNVIIYERIKEELSKGKGYIPAINEGYKRSLPPVLDAHVTTLLTAFILFYFGLGPVKGFATTQIIGILLSLFCGILVSRWITDIFTNKKKHLEYFTGISRRIFKHAKFKFIEYRKIAYIISFVVLALGIASFFNGFSYGVEFNGGRSYTIQFDKKVDEEKVREDLNKAFEGENTIIKTIGDNSKLDITTSYLIKDTRPSADSVVAVKLYEGLKSYLPANLSFEQFKTEKYMPQSKKVLPTISDDLKKGALKATLFALLVIFLYIFIRFRDWRYSLGTIVALLHDVFVTLIVFSFAKAIVPFPLEIDQHFIAAVLTVIGFSMNDTVIVFDRIREDSRLMPTAPRAEVINRAINETLSRTIMTSLTVFLTILILFLVGGEVTRGFAFAMLIGVITGTYSSIFVAAPILVDLGGKRPLGKKAVVEKKPSVTTSTKI
ncbi:MAG TPA: protein translocase subunit SecDF [Chitinophagaceae bacterium]|nr:protein translocase subunit SecDF [Chitinophagaceae bacterium]HNU14141.1 protein translocase subunit SecDF [Chitinophagaceae bacterium]